MAYKSKDPLRELYGPAPWINNYDDYFLMNSQGVFGFINQHRVQIVLKYTHDPIEKIHQNAAKWDYLDFKCLPGSPGRRPPLLSPYHSRFDWESWIRVTASMEQLYQNKAPQQAYFQHLPDFFDRLIRRILSGDEDAAGLMGVPLNKLYSGANNAPPRAISMQFAHYTFTKPDQDTSDFWNVENLTEVALFDGAEILGNYF